MTGDPLGSIGTDSAGAVPVCPRHPDRESYVRCQRCERPVCPQCQRPAAVGVQCVDCVQQGAKAVRTARTVFGGTVRQGAPVVTYTIIGLCVAAFLGQWTLGGRITDSYSFVPLYARDEPWRFLTSAFLHSPGFVVHILFNMYALNLLGPYLEALLGRARYAALYLISAFGGSVGYFVLATPGGSQWVTPVVGASGAIFGLFSALVAVNRRLGRDNGAVIGVLVINLVLGFIPGLNIAWQAHLGGLITGALLAGVFVTGSARQRTAWHTAGTAAVLVLLLVLTVVKLASVPAGYLMPPPVG